MSRCRFQSYKGNRDFRHVSPRLRTSSTLVPHRFSRGSTHGPPRCHQGPVRFLLGSTRFYRGSTQPRRDYTRSVAQGLHSGYTDVYRGSTLCTGTTCFRGGSSQVTSSDASQVAPRSTDVTPRWCRCATSVPASFRTGSAPTASVTSSTALAPMIHEVAPRLNAIYKPGDVSGNSRQLATEAP